MDNLWPSLAIVIRGDCYDTVFTRCSKTCTGIATCFWFWAKSNTCESKMEPGKKNSTSFNFSTILSRKKLSARKILGIYIKNNNNKLWHVNNPQFKYQTYIKISQFAFYTYICFASKFFDIALFYIHRVHEDMEQGNQDQGHDLVGITNEDVTFLVLLHVKL